MQSQHGTAVHPRSQDPILEEMLRRLTDAFQPERVYLFGSQARGEAGPDSDYDLLMVVKSPACRGIDASRSIRALIGVGAAKDVLVLTRGIRAEAHRGLLLLPPSNGKAFCSMQPETAVEARAWFQKATNDLRGADIDLAAAPPSSKMPCFVPTGC